MVIDRYMQIQEVLFFNVFLICVSAQDYIIQINP